MSDRPPQWGEPGYVPPPRPKVPLRPGQRRALWFALVLAALGQVAYWVGVGGGTSTGGTATANGTCCTGPFYDHPVVAAAGFLASMGALALVVPVVRSWSELLLPRFAIVVPLLVALGLGLDLALSALAPLGCACW
jgi:hypothetical protein